MLAEMPWRQFLGWMAYYELEPFGEERADLRLGIMASLFANANSDPKKTKPRQPNDFIPDFLAAAGAVGARKQSTRGARRPLTSSAAWSGFSDTVMGARQSKRQLAQQADPTTQQSTRGARGKHR